MVVHSTGGLVLLMNRTQPRGFWQSVTGSLDWGESPRQAAIRELFEETGLQLNDGELKDTDEQHRFAILSQWRSRYAPTVQSNLEHVFEFKLDSVRQIRMNPVEHWAYCWLPISKAAEQASSQTNCDAILSLPMH